MSLRETGFGVGPSAAAITKLGKPNWNGVCAEADQEFTIAHTHQSAEAALQDGVRMPRLSRSVRKLGEESSQKRRIGPVRKIAFWDVVKLTPSPPAR